MNKRLLLGLGTVLAFSIAPSAFAKKELVMFRDSALGVEVKHTCKGTKREIARCREIIRRRFVASVACAQSGGVWAKPQSSAQGVDWTMNQKTCIKPEPSAQASSLPNSTDQGHVTGGSTSGVGY